MNHPFNNIATEAARSASRVIMRFVDRLDVVTSNQKGLNDYVTEIDHLAQQEIITHIQKAYPQHGIIAEEGDQNTTAEYTWVIDPLDGTANFLHGIPHLAISIAVLHKNEPMTGLIYEPFHNELFTAVKGKGAQLNHRRIRVSSRRKLDECLIATGFPFRNKSQLPSYLDAFQNVFQACSDIRRAGSAALDLAYVAAGRLDGYWESNLNIWDIAAGALLVQEAGGIITDLKGGDQHLSNGSILAANPQIHPQLSELVVAT